MLKIFQLSKNVIMTVKISIISSFPHGYVGALWCPCTPSEHIALVTLMDVQNALVPNG